MADIKSILAEWTNLRDDSLRAVFQRIDESFALRRLAYAQGTSLRIRQLRQELKKIKNEKTSRQLRIRVALQQQKAADSENSAPAKLMPLMPQNRHDIKNMSIHCTPVPRGNVRHSSGMEQERCGQDREDSIKVPQGYRRDDIMGRYTFATISENVANATEANEVNSDISTVTIDSDSDMNLSA